MRNQHYPGVGALVSAIKRIVNGQPALQNISVDGEVLKARITTNGHLYFTLKDSEGEGEIGCVAWSSTVRRLSYLPNNGDRVTVSGTVEVKYQNADLRLYAVKIEPAGLAQFYLQYQQLTAKLEREGLFLPEHKKELPRFPMSIAVVTGDGTSGYQDVMHWLSQRWPVARVQAYPCMVQGNSAPRDIIRALRTADEGGHDLILLVRGGGGFMELFCFNDEELARCIYALNTPVVTGIGHEDDTTIADRVADRRSNVPSAAVVESTPDIREVLNYLETSRSRIQYSMSAAMTHTQTRMKQLSGLPLWQDPYQIIKPAGMRLAAYRGALMQVPGQVRIQRNRLNTQYQLFQQIMLEHTRSWNNRILRCSYALEQGMRQKVQNEQTSLQYTGTVLNDAMRRSLDRQKERFARDTGLLDAYSPLAILARGYSVALKDNTALRSADDVAIGDTVTVRLHDGVLITETKGKSKL